MLLLKPVLAVLVHSWDLCGRSWAALGADVGGLGAEVIGLGNDQGEKWPKPERERDPQRVGPPEDFEEAEAPYPFFFIDTSEDLSLYSDGVK